MQLDLRHHYHCLVIASFGYTKAIAKDLRRKHPSPLPGQSLLLRVDVEWARVEEGIRSYTTVAQEGLVTAVFLHSQLPTEQMAGLAIVVCCKPQVQKEVRANPAGCTLPVLMVDLEKVVYHNLQVLKVVLVMPAGRTLPVLTEDLVKDVCHSLVLMDFCHILQDLRCRNQAAALFDYDHPFRLLYSPPQPQLP